MANEELTRGTIADMAARLRTGQVSPVDVTAAHLARIDRLNGSLKAYLTVLPERAMAAARRAETEIRNGRYRGPLHGVPVAVKDLYAIKGERMTCGSTIMAEHVAEQHATANQRLEDAGAVLLGTLNMHEFAWGGTSINPHYGTPRNPWDGDRIPGGSSGGSGVATGAGLAMATLGSDTGGSIRIPASLSGVVGLKPTYGRVSRHGVYPLCWSLDHPGPLTRSVADAALVLRAIAGHDANDPTTSRLPVPDYEGQLTGEVRGLRVGVPRALFFDQIDPQVAAAVEAAVGELTRPRGVVRGRRPAADAARARRLAHADGGGSLRGSRNPAARPLAGIRFRRARPPRPRRHGECRPIPQGAALSRPPDPGGVAGVAVGGRPGHAHHPDDRRPRRRARGAHRRRGPGGGGQRRALHPCLQHDRFAGAVAALRVRRQGPAHRPADRRPALR